MSLKQVRMVKKVDETLNAIVERRRADGEHCSKQSVVADLILGKTSEVKL